MGVDPARFRPDADARALHRSRLGWPDDVPVVGFVGRLVPEKGVDLLLDAVVRVEWLHAIVVGGGPEEDALRRRVSEAGTSGRVAFVGKVPSGLVPGWMATFDALALPSRTRRTWAEQFGRVLVEAMACGIPVVVSDSGEMTDVVGDGGVSVPEGDVGCLAEALTGLLGDADARRRRGNAGRQRVLERFTQAAVAEATAVFYRSLPTGTP
jgi:glycosyltransferase involved in cell wall biosynthesis